jgi:hypothetical protein
MVTDNQHATTDEQRKRENNDETPDYMIEELPPTKVDPGKQCLTLTRYMGDKVITRPEPRSEKPCVYSVNSGTMLFEDDPLLHTTDTDSDIFGSIAAQEPSLPETAIFHQATQGNRYPVPDNQSYEVTGKDANVPEIAVGLPKESSGVVPIPHEQGKSTRMPVTGENMDSPELQVSRDDGKDMHPSHVPGGQDEYP